MKTKIIVLSAALLAVLSPAIVLSAPVPTSGRTPLPSVSTPGESLVLDPATGNYTITYADLAGNLQQAKFVPATKIEPVVSSSIQLDDNGIIAYRYTIANGRAAKQPIIIISIKNISSFYSSQPLPPYTSPGETLASGLAAAQSWDALVVTPDRWHGDASPDLDHASMVEAGWIFFTDRYPNEKSHIGVAPGEKQPGFGFVSRDLPAIGQVKLWGEAPMLEFDDEGPNPGSVVGNQLDALKSKDFVLRNIAAPAIVVPSPFDAVALLESVQAQTHSWIDKQLLDATFSSLLDRSFQSAISAYRLNQPTVGKQEIQTMRELLRKEQPDLGRDEEHESDKNREKNDDRKSALIDRLAARVLDFDLKYVTKRAAGDKDE
jgi:hypothetical protein